MAVLHVLSIIMEMAVFFLGVKIALRKKKSYGWGIAFTFLVYVVYDFSRFLCLDISGGFLYSLFFLATASILWAVYKIYKTQ